MSRPGRAAKSDPARLGAIAALVALACTARPSPGTAESSRESLGPPVPAIYAPRCRGAEDLTGLLATFDDLPVGVVPVTPTQKDAKDAIELANGPWLFLLFSGHGSEVAGRSSVCLTDEQVPVNDWVQALGSAPSSVRGTVLVLNACESAAVDPSATERPLSIISASPINVRTDSLFGESIGPALLLAAEDWNCDGLVTDQEFFDALLSVLDRSHPASLRPTLPKIRRQATSEIPLPIRPLPRAACQGVSERVSDLVARHRDEWGELAVAFLHQLDLAKHPDVALPKTDHDYYFARPAPLDAATRATIEKAAQDAGLAPLPASAEADAEELAHFSTFTQIYRLDVDCGYVRVVRLSDGTLVASEALGELAQALPRRRTLSIPRRLFAGARAHLRILGIAGHEGPAVPCYEQTGQCFGLASAEGAQ